MKKYYFIFLVIFSASAMAQVINVVNMTPNSLSNEIQQDSEPNLSINPNNPLELVGSAFTFNPSGATSTAPVYISQNGGDTWVLNNIVPSGNGRTGDITVDLSKNNTLYSGILTGGSGLQMQILRSNNYLLPGTMTSLLTRNNVDQPYVEVISPLGGSGTNNDRLYVGNNDFSGASGRTASIEQSLNSATAPAPANLTTERLEVRSTAGQDGPPIRTATHPDGTVYAIFDRLTNISVPNVTSDVIVVRDDDWGQGATSYNNLTDPSDGLAGRIIVSGITWTFNSGVSGMGQARIGDRFSIAVDPRDSQTVYIVYVDRPTTTINSNRLNVLRSTDGGNNWSATLLTANNITIPQLAVNTLGQVGLLYQQLITGQWVTRFRQSNDGGTTWSNNVLHQAPSNIPTATFAPYLGDYADLIAFGKDFYGIFSGNNSPNNANFPNGVTYQRNANFATNSLRNITNTANVNVSIDPFFFSVKQISDDEDFYVRDWTDSSTSNDVGLEPSTDPVFYNTSDVWNRRTNAPAPFSVNDRPQSEDPQIASLGNNFAFARVHRKGTGSAETVGLHFLKSEFGTGSNYVNANTTTDPTLSFLAGESSKVMSSGYEWTLTAIGSTHTCIAVEISTTNDPVVVPTLLGRAPGWPTTDLSVLYDNNKAQRNMGVHTMVMSPSPGGLMSYYAVLHNAALYTRDMELKLDLPREFKGSEIFMPFQGEIIWKSDDQIVIPKMLPGENRWIGIKVPMNKEISKSGMPISMTEIVDNIPVNGFTISIGQGTVKEVFYEAANLHANNFNRIGNLFGIEEAIEESKLMARFLKGGYNFEDYYKYLEDRIELIEKVVNKIINLNGEKDLFDLKRNIDEIKRALKEGKEEDLVNYHSSYSQKLDAYITFVDKSKGDVADIIQNIRWQSKLYRSNKDLMGLKGVDKMLETSERFIIEYSKGNLTAKDYISYIEKEVVPVFKTTAGTLPNAGLEGSIKNIDLALNKPQALQKAHYGFLTKLSNYVKS